MITVGSFADNDAARLRPVTAVTFPEESEDVDDTGEVKFGRALGSEAYVSPLRKGGGAYVTPNSGWTQNGQAAGSETS